MSVRKSLAWSYGAQGVIFVVSFSSSVIVARILGPYEMGIFAVGTATAGALSILSSFGVGAYLVRHEAIDAITKSTVFTVNALLNLVLSVAIGAVTLAGPLFDLNTQVQHVLMLIALTPLISVFEFLPSTLLQRDMNFRAIALISIGRTAITACVVIAMAVSGLGALSPAIGMVVSSLFTAVAFNVIGRHHASVKLGLTGWRDVASFGFQMMSIGGVAALAQRLSELVLGRLLGFAALGVYVRASGLAGQLWDNVYGLSTRVIFSQMAKEMRETKTVSKTFLSGLSLITALVWPLMAGVAILSGPLIHTLYGDKWSEAAWPLAIIVTCNIIGLGFGMNWELCVLTKRTGWQARVEASRAVVTVVSFTLGSLISLTAAAAGRLVDAVYALCIYGPKMRGMAGSEPGQISHVFVQSAMLTLAAAGPSLLLMIASDWSPHTSLALIGLAIAVGAMFWFALLRSYRHALFDEMLRIWVRVVPRQAKQGTDGLP